MQTQPTTGPASDLALARRVVETIHEPLLVLDEGLRVRAANPSFYRTFAADPGATEGERLLELADGCWAIPELEERLDRVLGADEPFEGFELDRTFPDLGRRVMRLNGRILEREHGESRMMLLAIEDVTERRELEAALRRQRRELERSNQELEQFAYAASHDLQEPLRMVASYLELLEARYGDRLDGEAREFIDYAVDGAERMKALINGLLEYSRVGRKEGAFVEVGLDGVLSEVLADLAGRIEATGADVTSGPLPTAHGNAGQLRQLLQNLIENALTYHGEEPPAIEVTGERGSEGTVRVEVTDEGPGVPVGMQEKVFRLFHQLDPHGEGREGSGMGLALCRKIVERHGGQIGIESAPDEGATFHFTLALEAGETA